MLPSSNNVTCRSLSLKIDEENFMFRRKFSFFQEAIGAKINESLYEMKSQRDHIIHRPDMYIGSVKNIEKNYWVYDSQLKQMIQRKVQFNAGLLKIFDEILVNAADQHAEHPTLCKNIWITINDEGRISVRNDGHGIPVVKHGGTGKWLPVMLFGSLRTSSNFHEEKGYVTGGRFGYGAKLTNILSKEFQVITRDSHLGKTLRVQWRNGMRSIDDPVISYCNKDAGGFTEINFVPNYQLLGMKNGLSADMLSVLQRRVYDFSGLLKGIVNLFYNGERLETSSFRDFAALFPPKLSQSSFAESENCSIILRVSDNGFHQISFANTVHTIDGGTHVDYVIKNVCYHLKREVERQYPSFEISLELIRQNIFLIMSCQVKNPEFDSQIKGYLQSSISSVAGFPDIEKLARRFCIESDIISRLLSQVGLKKAVKKASARKNLGIRDFFDAEMAGVTAERCSMMLVEGTSAMAFAMSGISMLGRELHGAFPVFGKISNTWNVSSEDCLPQRLRDLLDTLSDKDRNGGRVLRYGKIILMTDADSDGFHIRGLLICFLKKFVPQYIHENRVHIFLTPVVKIAHKDKEYFPYEIEKLSVFLGQLGDIEKEIRIKHYKGLGSHTQEEITSFFTNYRTHLRQLVYVKGSDDLFACAFGDKGKQQYRKDIKDSEEAISCDNERLTYNIFFEQYKGHISRMCYRSLPHVGDGLTPARRKILFTMLGQSTCTPMKVTQFAGRVSHVTAYHHSQESLNKTIILLAQDFVGANNTPLLVGAGNFGTRADNGDDCAQSRYLSVKASPLLPLIFPKDDFAYLNCRYEDGIAVEPEYLTPVIPLHFLNGFQSCAMSFSTRFHSHALVDLINQVRKALQSMEYKFSIKPFHINFRGFIEDCPNRDSSYRTIGNITVKTHNSVHITEIPIDMSINTYRAHLKRLRQEKIVFSFYEYHDSQSIDFHVYLYNNIITTLNKAEFLHLLPAIFGLKGAQQTSIPVCTKNNGIKVFKSQKNAFDDYISMRLQVCEQRIHGTLASLSKKRMKLRAELAFHELLYHKKISLSSASALKGALHDLGVSCENEVITSLLKTRVGDVGSIEKRKAVLSKVQESIGELQQKCSRDLWLDELDALEAKVKSIRKRPSRRKIEFASKVTPSVSFIGLENLKSRIQRAKSI